MKILDLEKLPLKRKRNILKKRKFTYLKRVKVTSNFNLQNQQHVRPIKIINSPLPKFNYPSLLQTCLHQNQVISYQGNSQFFSLPLKKILYYTGTAKLSVPQMEIQIEQIPQLVKNNMKQIHKANLWLYRGKRITKWHYDGHDNFLYVKQGTKIIYLAQPNSLKSQSLFSLFSNHLKEGSKTQKNKILKTKLKKGDCLFIPKGWWHYVISNEDPNIAINFWGNSVSKILQSLTEIDKKIILKELIFKKCDLQLQNRIPSWKEQDQKYKQYLRKVYYLKLIQKQ